MSVPLHVTAAGACTAVGMSLVATDCALRACMDHFADSEFIGRNGDPIRVARLPNDTLWGRRRLVRWAATAIEECLDAPQPTLDLRRTPLLLLAAERDRPHSDEQRYRQIYAELEANLGHGFGPQSQIVPLGRSGIGPALALAQQWFAAGTFEDVLIVGVDSFLDAATINHLLAQRRLLADGNGQGFLPGEAAAAVRLSATPQPGSIVLRGLGLAEEAGRLDGSVPSRAQGLTHALRSAIAQSALVPEDFDLRLSDQNGESFYAREAANALTRLGPQGLAKLPVLTLADGVGEIGAALGPLMLGWMRLLLQRADRIGSRVLAHVAGDDGSRVALVLTCNTD